MPSLQTRLATTPVLWLFFLILVSAGVWWNSLVSTLHLALSDEGYTHILLIPPLALALLVLEKKLSGAPVKDPSGVGWMAGGLLLAAFAKFGPVYFGGDVRLALSIAGLVTFWLGSVLLCLGRQTVKALLFPICFLYWIVPLPEVVLEEIIYFLQVESAFAARVMFKLAGVPVTQDGIILSIPNLDIEVARECSSIRSSMLLVVTTVLLAHLFLKTWWRKAILIAFAIPLAAIKNGFRIFVITELGTRVDPGFFDGNLHHHGGILFLGMALIAASVLLWFLHRSEAVNESAAKRPVV